MHINIVTLFPEWFTSPLETALLGKAKSTGRISINLLNPRNWTNDKHATVDDRPYGGGPGMVMMLEPLVHTLRDIATQPEGYGRILVLSASGKPLTQQVAQELSHEKTLTLICGRYEGIDARLPQFFPVEEICIGDIVINGGESAAMILIESTTRLIPGVIGKEASCKEESFSDGLLEYPHYTRPETFENISVPDVLLNGDHKKIATWRKKESLRKTFCTRPSMLNTAQLSPMDLSFFHDHADEFKKISISKNLHCALLHYPVLLDDKKIGATSLTNLDIHDIARCTKTYDLGSFTLITPLQDQQAIANTIVQHWTVGAGGKSNPDRAEALKLVKLTSTLQELIDTIENDTEQPPLLIGTSARDTGILVPNTIQEFLYNGPIILLFGTGHGIAPEILEMCFGVLRPLRYINTYNHLSVRSAVAITLDRILGDVN